MCVDVQILLQNRRLICAPLQLLKRLRRYSQSPIILSSTNKNENLIRWPHALLYHRQRAKSQKYNKNRHEDKRNRSRRGFCTNFTADFAIMIPYPANDLHEIKIHLMWLHL
jgi:hypothetical protein